MELAAAVHVQRLPQTEPQAAADVLARAMVNQMEELAVYLLARKYPPDVNAPLFAIDLLPADEAAASAPEPEAEAASKNEAAPKAAKPSAGRFMCPSTFMVAIAFELEELVALMLMVRRARTCRHRLRQAADGTEVPPHPLSTTNVVFLSCRHTPT